MFLAHNPIKNQVAGRVPSFQAPLAPHVLTSGSNLQQFIWFKMKVQSNLR